MKAYSLHGINNLKYEDVDYPECQTGWSIVKVKSAGICSSDISRIFIKGTYHFPTIPGHEFSGVVAKVADKENEALLGEKVGVFPLIPCQKCDQCAEGHYEMCSNYDYIGSRRDGGFAEYVAVPIWNLVTLTDAISFEEGAMMEPFAVALHAIKQAEIKKGDTIAIIGTGMIAFAAAQWAKKAGAVVTVLGRSFEKRKFAESIADLKYEIIDLCKDEFDVVLEAVGSNISIEKGINIAKSSGRLILMGNPEGNITLPQNTYWRILRKQLHITGTWNSFYKHGEKSDWTTVRDALVNQELKAVPLISHRFFQDELMKGLNLMYKHKEPYCKVMTLWNSKDED